MAAAVPRFRASSYGRRQRAFARLGVSHLDPVLPHLWQSTFVAGCHPSRPGLVVGIAHGGQGQPPPPREAGAYTRSQTTFYTFPVILRECGSCVTVAAFLASGMRRALIVYPLINPAEKRPADIAVSTARHELFPRSCARRDAVPVMRARVIQPWQTAFNNLAIVAPPPPKTPRRATRGCF